VWAAGLDVLLEEVPQALRGARVGLLTHAGAVDARGRPAVDALAAHRGLRVVRLLAPEHGLRGERPAGDPVPDGVDGATGLPVVSLYGSGFRREAVAGLDAVLVDVQDLGCRYYTYPGTVRRLVRLAAAEGVPVWVLDRPNPLGAGVAGPRRVPPAWRSLVAAFDVPVRHGATVGELILAAAREDGVDPALVSVVPVRGWRRRDAFRAWGRPWVPPSPNATGPEMAELYPGTCLFEGTDLSEGRGTPYPFRQVGAPWLDAARLARELSPRMPEGLGVRPAWFVPASGKHQGQLCQGVFLDVRPEPPPPPDAALVAAVRLLGLLVAQEAVRWVPAEGVPWLDRLLGGSALRTALAEGRGAEDLLAAWREEAAAFAAERPVRLYDG
jgi:uncharacterized protein YbbC (DUF1343 family)